jgi:lysylphosphatidylglycerol synthetase-like protein (DUF2156 family)
MPRVHLLLSLLAAALTIGCFDSKEERSDCIWPAHGSTPLKLARESDRAHLTADVELAEELAIRYGDVRWGPGTTRREKAARECLEPLFATIIAEHGVAREDIDTLRDSLSHRGMNLTTNVPMALLYLGVCTLVVLKIGRRFSPSDELLPFAMMALLASGVVAVATVGVGWMWEMALETFRVGNTHLGPARGFRLQWFQYRRELTVGAIALFWFIAAGYAVVRLRLMAPASPS